MNFLDSDDIVEPDHLAVAAGVISKFPEVQVFHLGYSLLNMGDGRTIESSITDHGRVAGYIALGEPAFRERDIHQAPVAG